NAEFTASDLANFAPPNFPGSAEIDPGESFSLGLITFAVDVGVAPGTSVSVEFGDDTSLSDELGNTLGLTAIGGGLQVAAVGVPEPGSLTLAGVVMILGAGGLVMKRRKAASAHRDALMFPPTLGGQG